MTMPDNPSPESTDAAAPRADSAEPQQSEHAGAHSAPRPVPDLAARPVPPAPPTPVPPPAPGPARVSAFPPVRAEGRAEVRADPEETPAADLAAADLAAAVTEVEPAATPGSAPELEVAEAVEVDVEPLAATAPLAPLPVEPGSTTTTRVVPAGSTVPLATPAALAPATTTQPAPTAAASVPAASAPGDEGWVPQKTSRTAAHIWGVVLTLLAVPPTWFLLSDGALRTWSSLAEGASSANVAGLLSLAGGIAGLVIIALVARASSLGAWIWGGIVTLGGVAALAVPARATQLIDYLGPGMESVHPGFGRNLHDFLLDSSLSGLLLVFGVVVLLFALVAHAARRSGRTEGRIAERAAAAR